jgi:formate dehydrogenase subunit beta
VTDHLIKTKKGQTRSQAVVAHLKTLMEKGVLDAVLIQKPTPRGRSYRHTLVTEMDQLDDADPFVPVMPVSGATALSRLTKHEAPSGNVGVVLRPCEVSAAVILHKLLQVRFNDVRVMTFDCSGTLDMNEFTRIVDEGGDPWKVIADEPERKRQPCSLCFHIQHIEYHMDLGMFGVDDDKVLVKVKDDALAGGLDEAPEEMVKVHKAKLGHMRKEWQENLFASADQASSLSGVEGFNKFFEDCIVCHNCMDQCPVCYCNECFFESQTFRYEGDKMMLWARNRGGLQMPTDKAMFHLGRMAHMVLTCVYCGMCSQACPAGIDVAALFGFTSSQVIHDYEPGPGISLMTPLPQAVYREDELEPR